MRVPHGAGLHIHSAAASLLPAGETPSRRGVACREERVMHIHGFRVLFAGRRLRLHILDQRRVEQKILACIDRQSKAGPSQLSGGVNTVVCFALMQKKEKKERKCCLPQAAGRGGVPRWCAHKSCPPRMIKKVPPPLYSTMFLTPTGLFCSAPPLLLPSSLLLPSPCSPHLPFSLSPFPPPLT